MKHEKTTSKEKHGILFLALSFFVGLAVSILSAFLVVWLLGEIMGFRRVPPPIPSIIGFFCLGSAAAGMHYVADILKSLYRSKFYADHANHAKIVNCAKMIKDNPLIAVGILVIIALIFPPLKRSGFEFGVIFFTRSSRIDYNVWFMEILVILIFSGLYLLHRKNSEKKDSNQEKDSDDFS